MSHTDRLGLTLAAIVAVTALSGGRAEGQVTAQAPNSQPNPYDTIENYFRLSEGRTIGSTPAIDIDRDGSSIWVFERCGANSCVGSDVDPILKFDPSGNVVTSFGGGMFVWPHGIHVDRDGNVWVTDARSATPEEIERDPAARGKGHQVFKFSPDGKVLLKLGQPGVPGDDPDTFNGPSDVITAPNGDIFVGDGHGGETNARIVKFTKNGKFIKAWGMKGSAQGEFETPHALAMDSRGRLFVGDRGNGRIQIFDQEGRFLQEWKQFGRPSGLFIDANDTLYSADSQANEANPGVWREGIRIGSVDDGKVTAFIPDPDPVGSQEGVVADAKGNVYGSLTAGMALKKYVKK